MKREPPTCPESLFSTARNYINRGDLSGFFEWIRFSPLTNYQVIEIIGYFRQNLPKNLNESQLQSLLQEYLDALFQKSNQELLVLVMSWYVSVSRGSDPSEGWSVDSPDFDAVKVLKIVLRVFKDFTDDGTLVKKAIGMLLVIPNSKNEEEDWAVVGDAEYRFLVENRFKEYVNPLLKKYAHESFIGVLIQFLSRLISEGSLPFSHWSSSAAQSRGDSLLSRRSRRAQDDSRRDHSRLHRPRRHYIFESRDIHAVDGAGVLWVRHRRAIDRHLRAVDRHREEQAAQQDQSSHRHSRHLRRPRQAASLSFSRPHL